jgi:hypothetical protein
MVAKTPFRAWCHTAPLVAVRKRFARPSAPETPPSLPDLVVVVSPLPRLLRFD